MKVDKSIITPTQYCKYASGACDQSMDNLNSLDAFFIYPSQPKHMANTIMECLKNLQKYSSESKWLSWEKLHVSGQIIFCEICKAIRSAKLIVANITNMNFNVLFELGYAIGLLKPVLPVRDTSYESQKKIFDEIGIFDTLGFQPFTNSKELSKLVSSKKVFSPPVYVKPYLNKNSPVYFIRSPIDTEGSIKLFSCLKKSWFRFRTFDSREIPRLSLHEAYKQVLSSISVVAHLLDDDRTGASIHNARAAFVCGMAMSAGKHVLMLQEGANHQQIDYRDIVIPYTEANAIPQYIESILRETANTLQSFEQTQVPLPKELLERIDLGDIAAENEIQALSMYFVKTPQFQQARQGHARIVIGRKGTGKTAMFYGIRSQFAPRSDKLVLDLKPEGHQFIRLREMVLSNLSEGLQVHTLTAFWHYILLLEITYKVLAKEVKIAFSNDESCKEYNELEYVYKKHVDVEGDFSERLMTLVNRLINEFPTKKAKEILTPDITQAIYRSDIKSLSKILIKHLKGFKGVLILFDNIDKGFPTHGLKKEDILIIRCLFEATRKIQHDVEINGIDCVATIFIRRDVFDHLIDMTPDRGKESYVNLDWSDIELMKELLILRFRYQAPELDGSFEEVWSRLFDPHVRGESSFNYVLARTFLRPRDILNFVRKCIQIAVSRGHERVQQDDIFTAEEGFSEDMLNELRYEIRDIFPDLPDVALAFIGADNVMSGEEIDLRLSEAGVPENKLEEVREILLWFAFIGICMDDNESYSYIVSYNMAKLRATLKDTKESDMIYSIHPAFRRILSTVNKNM